MTKSKKKVSAATVAEIILIIILILVMLLMLASNFLFKKENAAASLFGYSFYNTKAVNMLPDFPKDTVVIAKASEIKNIRENSVVLCNIGEHTVLIRVVEIEQTEEGTYYVVKFDTSPASETYRVSSDAVIAKAIWQINGMGGFLEFATSTVGIIIAIVIPLIFIIAIQVAKMLGIKRLEDEAASIDDIDEFIQSRDEEEPAAVTFTEPKFIEDVTGKIPASGGMGIREPEPPKEKVLSFDSRGRAEYIEKPPRPAEKKPEPPLFTYEDLTEKQPVHAAAGRGDLYMNRPTRIEAEKDGTDELLKKYVPDEDAESVVFTPHLKSVIPDSIAAVQEETAAMKKSGSFNDSVKSYFEKTSLPPADAVPLPAEEKPAIPEKAVLPKETIAPPKKRESNKAVAELMSIIDAEENKLKK